MRVKDHSLNYVNYVVFYYTYITSMCEMRMNHLVSLFSW